MPESKQKKGESVTTPASETTATTGAGPDAVEEEVREAAVEYFDKLTEAAGKLTEQARQVYSLSHDYAREHPTGMIIGAFGLGVLLGMLFDRD